MSQIAPQCHHLREQVNQLLELLRQEPTLRSQQDTSTVETALGKALSPRFEIVFAGAFSAGKSMLINALLERELLYSAEGHATGTECHIEYAKPNEERVVLTFLSEAEIRQQALIFVRYLDFGVEELNINQPESVKLLNEYCQRIVTEEGGANKSERAKQANALNLLLTGFEQNRERIQTVQNASYEMDQLNFSSLGEAASYARRGPNSAVLKRLDYYCNHPLLQDGNVLVDLPGIDAPIKEHRELAYNKIQDPQTSAIVCVLKAAATGELGMEETLLLEKIGQNPGIRDRVFYVFNRIDETWFAAELRQRLESLIQSHFRGNSHLYETSGLLGFYGSQVKKTSIADRFGLDSIFAKGIKDPIINETPRFVSEFIKYCAGANKLSSSEFRVVVRGYKTPIENYIDILSEWGMPLMDKLINDSGIESFRSGIGRYLAEEKYPELFATLANDLQPLCIALRQFYLEQYRQLDSQPREIEAMKAQELALLNYAIQELGLEFQSYISYQVNDIITGMDKEFEQDFGKLKARMVSRLDELIKTFSVMDAYSRATLNHPRHATAPFLAVLVEALYFIADELEDVLVDGVKNLVGSHFNRLFDRINKADCYHTAYRLLGNDAGIENALKKTEEDIIKVLISAARSECDRYVRESPRFYHEGTFSIYQFRQTLQQTSQGYDAEAIIEAEPSIRQLLKLDFEPKLSETIHKNFRLTINNALKTHLIPMSKEQSEMILQQFDTARAYLEKSLEKEAEEKITRNSRLQSEIQQKIDQYQGSVAAINECLKAMQIVFQLPTISTTDMVSSTVEVIDSEILHGGEDG